MLPRPLPAALDRRDNVALHVIAQTARSDHIVSNNKIFDACDVWFTLRRIQLQYHTRMDSAIAHLGVDAAEVVPAGVAACSPPGVLLPDRVPSAELVYHATTSKQWMSE